GNIFGPVSGDQGISAFIAGHGRLLFYCFFCRLEGEDIGIVTVESLARRFASLCMSEKERRFQDSGQRLLF
ncbi:MAG: hypothetical protein WCD13_20360, partial [Pseudolabrys sp.]